ncbi:MAG: hypothetical protein NTY64_15695, partial [Deltaproteobacteria bacterium]|nr:hypothetical protein [Deltaproteobacteria bacterium]
FLRFLGPQYKYQFYKILLSTSPLLPLGITLAWAGENLTKKSILGSSAIVAFLFLFCFSFLGTFDMALRSGIGRSLEAIGRGGAYKLLDPGILRIQDFLERLKGEKVLIAWQDDFFGGGYVNGWLAYWARNNRVWITNPLVSDLDVRDLKEARWQLSEPFSQGFLISSPLLGRLVGGASARRVRPENSIFGWQISGSNWAAVSALHNPNGLERAGEEDFFWVGNVREPFSFRPKFFQARASPNVRIEPS